MRGSNPFDESPAYPLLLISVKPSPSPSNEILCHPPINTPSVVSPAEITCSTTPSPSISIVTIDFGIDHGSNTKGEFEELICDALISLNVIFPSMVEPIPSAKPGIGVIKSKSPSLSKSAIDELCI